MPKRIYKSLETVDETPTSMVIRAFLAFPQKPTCIWDVGCGTGKVLIESKLRYRDVKLIGIEVNPDYPAVARENMERHGVNPADIDIHLRDACYDDLSDLQRPDAIYLSCAGRAEVNLIPILWEHLLPGGAIVCNVSQYGKHPDIPNWVARLRGAQEAYGGKLEDYTHWYDLSKNGRKDKWAVEDAIHWEGQKPV
jgi:precorrin-6B methylase 2